MKLDYSRPDLMFAVAWGLAVVLLMLLPVAFTVEPNTFVQRLILVNALGFVAIYWCMRRLTRDVRLQRPDWRSFSSDRLECEILRRYLRLLLAAWFPLYVLTILASGGLPVFWAITGSTRTYVDFGVPSLSGLLNMIRAFLFAGWLFLYFSDGQWRRLLVPAALLCSALCEVSRGGLLVLLLHGVAVYLLSRSLSLGRIAKLLILAAGFVILFGVLGEFRGKGLELESFVDQESGFSSLPSGVFFSFAYLVAPLNNLYFAADSIHPLYYPFNSLQNLVPTFIRSFFLAGMVGDEKYPISLFDSTFNATSFYSPLLADFGFIGAAIGVTGLQIYTAWVHVLARRGSMVHFLIYPALFMSVVLSVFYMYFLSMTVVLYPLLALGYTFFRNGVLKNRARA